MASQLKPNSTTTEINRFLAQVKIPNFWIHPKLVEFNDAKNRQMKKTLLYNKHIKEGLPEDAAQTMSEELSDSNTISHGLRTFTQKDSVLMLARLENRDLQQKLDSHVMLVFLKEKKVSNLFFFMFVKY
jgi:hypothetical protein